MKRREPRGRCREAPFGLLTGRAILPAGRRRRRRGARARATTGRPAGVRHGRGRGRRRRRHAIPVRVVAHAALIRVRASGDEPTQQHECTKSGDKRSHFLFILPGRGEPYPIWVDLATFRLPSLERDQDGRRSRRGMSKQGATGDSLGNSYASGFERIEPDQAGGEDRVGLT